MSIIDDIKSVAKTIQQVDNIELYKKILDVQSEALDLLEKNQELIEENKKLNEKLKIQAELVLKNNSYWIGDDAKNGPFCSRCWDVEKNLVRLHPCGNPAYYDCPNCKCGSVLLKPELDQVSNFSAPDEDPY